MSLSFRIVFFLALFLSIISLAKIIADEKSKASNAKTEIQAGSAKLVCVADASIASFANGGDYTKETNEQGTNAGLSERLKIKKYENQPILKFDFSKTPEGSTITEAFLEVYMLEDKPLSLVGVASLHVDWNEGEGKWNDEGKPDISHTGACFAGPMGVKSKWTNIAGENFTHAVAGNGGNATTYSKAISLGGGKWKILIAPAVVMAARENGQTLVISDETGIFVDPISNGFFCSRHVKDKEPVLNITWQKDRDIVAPAFRGKAEIKAGPYEGSLLIKYPDAGDDGLEGTAIGYRVYIDGKEIPRIMTPRPARKIKGSLIKDLPVGKEVEIKIVAYDEANNIAEQISKVKTTDKFIGVLAEPLKTNLTKAVSPETNKVFSAVLTDGDTLLDPLTGKISPKQLRALSKDGQVVQKNLFPALRGEILGVQCQINLASGVTELKDIEFKVLSLKGVDSEIPAENIELFREHFVLIKDSWIADILPAFKAGEKFSIPSQPNIPNQTSFVAYMDVIIPSNTKPGLYHGEVKVISGSNVATLPFDVEVRDITLPDELTFTVEMNAYGHDDDIKIFHETYRLCHKHRLSYNPLGYGHTRPASKCTPKLNTPEKAEDLKIVDWSLYDQFYGPIFSGEIAKDLPRKGIPATHFYLPFHDSWPYSLQKSIPSLFEGRVAPGGAKATKESKAAYAKWVNLLAVNDNVLGEQFNSEWRKGLSVIGGQFSDHFKEKGWTKTKMQIFNNHKYYFPSGSQSLWTMDEPQYGRDYYALNYMYRLQDEALSKAGIITSMRADISRPELIGDKMDETRSYDKTEGIYVVSSAINREKTLLENILTTSKASIWWYGGGSGAETDPCAVNALFNSRWCMGASGGMPVYMVEGDSNKWTETGSLRVIRYDEETKMPVASFRMKAYRRGQQDIELLNMLAKKKGFNRQHINLILEKEFSMKQVTISTGPDDPGYTTFEGLDSAAFDRMREKVIATLLK